MRALQRYQGLAVYAPFLFGDGKDGEGLGVCFSIL